MSTKIAILDTETSGLLGKTDKVCDVGGLILTFEEDSIVKVHSKLNTFVNPGVKLTPLVSSIHHITNKMVADAMPYDKLSSELVSFMEELKTVDYVGTYNLRFDWDFLVGLYPAFAEIPKKKRVCFLKTTQKYYPGATNHKLQFLRYEFEVDEIVEETLNPLLFDFQCRMNPEIDSAELQLETVQAHRAFGDVVITTGLLLYTLQDTMFSSWKNFFDLSTWNENSLMCMGKHRGIALKKIAKDDPDYIRWLFSQDWFEPKYPEIAQVLKELTCKN